ncbi:MAG: hypothetical protein FWF75_05865 [Propionibacteriaceae bacterium]|nr:hypothetical protein [Propionibacteriaceae bacterium]
MTLTQTLTQTQAQSEPATQPEAEAQTPPETQRRRKISQRDLRLHSREIMDALELGQSFTITRNGREIGEFVPKPRKPMFLTREEFIELGRGLPHIDADKFRADIDAVINPYDDNPDPWNR